MIEDVRRRLVEGLVEVPRVGRVVPGRVPPFVMVDQHGAEVEPVARYLRDLALGDVSPLTCRSYGYDLLTWFRLLWVLELGWDRATEAEVAVLVGWMRVAANPQRRRHRPESPAPGSVNPRTGKRLLPAGYAPGVINHHLTVIRSFYEFHALHGRGPVVNPVPESRVQRAALAHRSPLEPAPPVRRSRLRQKVPRGLPRAIPDTLWDELFAALRNDRDRALLLFYVSSGARASELLRVGVEDVDWPGMRVWVISKGTRLREPVPAEPEAFRYLARYLDQAGLPPAGQPVWRALRGESRSLSYWAIRRSLQRANARLGTNWSLHDLRHTAATRMANDPHLQIHEVQTVLRHASLATTSRYTGATVEAMFDRLQAHYARPRVEVSYPTGYDPADVAVVFGG